MRASGEPDVLRYFIREPRIPLRREEFVSNVER